MSPRRFAALFLAVFALVAIPVGFASSAGCASIPWEKRALAMEKAACLAQSEALEKALTKPGYGKTLLAEAQEASKRVMQALFAGREPDLRDMQTLAEAEALLGGVVECLQAVTLELQDLIIALVSSIGTLGGAIGYGRLRRGTTAEEDSSRESAIRREAKMEAAVDNLLEATRKLADRVEQVSKRTHEQGNQIQHHEMRLSALEEQAKVRRFAEV